jgi:hypothetical protein
MESFLIFPKASNAYYTLSHHYQVRQVCGVDQARESNTDYTRTNRIMNVNFYATNDLCRLFSLAINR